jgi:hypothetical protein
VTAVKGFLGTTKYFAGLRASTGPHPTPSCKGTNPLQADGPVDPNRYGCFFPALTISSCPLRNAFSSLRLRGQVMTKPTGPERI